jgi:hypothetical protein
MDFTFKKPVILTNSALRAGWPLLVEWKKDGKKEKEAKTQIPGFGWHEIKTNESAGFHASNYGLKLIANSDFPMSDSTRRQSANAVVELLKSTLNFSAKKASRKHRSHYLEAQNSTIKVANFLSACAAVGRNKKLKSAFKELQDTGRDVVKKLLEHECDGKWEHWLVKPGKNPAKIKAPKRISKEVDTYYPTATVFEAMFRFGRVDFKTRKETRKLLKNYASDMLGEFMELFQKYGENPPIKELWKRLPAIKTIAILDRSFFSGNNSGHQATRENFERIFNSYVRHELFAFELNHTDDFQKFDGNRAVGTDYVSFNTTACLARAIIGAVKTKKISPLFCQWVAPHLCIFSEQITTGRLPRPKRFSYIHQAFSCLLAATKLEKNTQCFPKKIRMNIFPKVFSQHSFRKMNFQGFYVTPFDFKTPVDLGISTTSKKAFLDFRAACRKCDRKINLVRGDHAPLGVITEKIWRYLNESKFIIAICAGANPNVYYEVGIAHTLGKPVLLIGRSGEKNRKDDFRFDIQGIYNETLKEFKPTTIRPVVRQFMKHVYPGEI